MEKKFIACAAAIYLLWSLALTWPLAANIGGFLLPEGFWDLAHSETYNFMRGTYVRSWLFVNGQGFFIPPYTMAQDYHVLGAASIMGLGFDVVVFHNLFFLACVFSSGLFACLLMRQLSGDDFASFFAGFIYMSSNFAFHAYYWGHVNYLQMQWIPLIFLFLERALERGGWADALGLGVAFFMQATSAEQYTAYLGFILPLYLVFRMSVSGKSHWGNLLLAVFLGAFLSGYFIVNQFLSDYYPFDISWSYTPSWRLMSFTNLLDGRESIFIGPVSLCLVVLGVAFIIQKRKANEYRRFVPFALLLPVLVILMAGPFSEYSLYSILFDHWPFFDYFRVSDRFFPFVLLSVSVLSSIPMLRASESARLRRHRLLLLALLVLAVVLFQFLGSYWLTNHHIYFNPVKWGP